MEKPDSNSVRLATELRQIILADRMAVDLINNAYDTKRSVEAKTAAEKQKILQEAEQKRKDALAKVAEEQREELAKRKAKTAQRFAGAREALEQEIETNRELWAAEIVGRITGAAPE